MRQNRSTIQKFDIIQILIIAALLAFMIVMLVSGGSKTVPVSRIETAMESIPSVAELTKKTVQDAAKTMSFDASAANEGIYYCVDDIMNVNELLILQIDDADAREQTEEAIQKYLDEKTASFDGYGTDQFGLLSNAVLTEKGSYLFFGVSPDVLQWESDFLASIR